MFRRLATALVVLGLAAGCAADEEADVTATSDDTAASEDAGAAEATTETEGADGDDAMEAEGGSDADEGSVTITLVTHDSFATSEGIFDSFTAETGIEVEVISGGDAGELVSRAVLAAGAPEGDVLFGVDNTFLQRALDGDVFEAHESPMLASVPDELELDPEHRVTPIDVGDVCVNYVIGDGPQPASIDDLTDPEFAAAFVTENPESSSPGFAFLLATIATYGDDWETYWTELAEGGVTVTAGWSEAYYGEFVSGGGAKTIVTSYATSPVAEVIFADPPVDTAPTAVLTDSCFRQIEFAGVLAGTDHPAEAGLLVDFLLSETFQADIPLNMFVAPANADVALPDDFVTHGTEIAEPLTLSPAEIEANRLAWTDRWTEIVLR